MAYKPEGNAGGLDVRVSLTLHRVTLVLFALTLVSRAVLTQVHPSARNALASKAQVSAPASSSDVGGQTVSPNPNSGFDQEERVRRLLAEQYEQRLGTSDEAIRSALGIRGKVADFVGYNARQNRWLIAESKGGNIPDAFNQLANTARGLLRKYPRAHVELRIYVKAEHYNFLRNGGNFGGYYMNPQGYLGMFDDLRKWEYATVEGIKILLQVAP